MRILEFQNSGIRLVFSLYEQHVVINKPLVLLLRHKCEIQSLCRDPRRTEACQWGPQLPHASFHTPCWHAQRNVLRRRRRRRRRRCLFLEELQYTTWSWSSCKAPKDALRSFLKWSICSRHLCLQSIQLFVYPSFST